MDLKHVVDPTLDSIPLDNGVSAPSASLCEDKFPASSYSNVVKPQREPNTQFSRPASSKPSVLPQNKTDEYPDAPMVNAIREKINFQVLEKLNMGAGYSFSTAAASVVLRSAQRWPKVPGGSIGTFKGWGAGKEWILNFIG